jgi:hypothetical protein
MPPDSYEAKQLRTVYEIELRELRREMQDEIYELRADTCRNYAMLRELAQSFHHLVSASDGETIQ